MEVINARNVNDAWMKAKDLLNGLHVVRPSRAGEVMEYPGPVTTVYGQPRERVLWDPVRDCNPFFHFMESLWMLAGRQDVEWIAQFNPRMREYSDNGKVFHGAYGHRWRNYFDMLGGAEEDFPDQLPKIARMLRKSHDERRAVLTMWDPVEDLERPELRDVPCNLVACFKIRNGALSMSVYCRSNDVIWGCLGANAVHFSILQEYLAAMIGVPMGPYYQISDSWHAYTERWEQYGGRSNVVWHEDYYVTGSVSSYPLVDVDRERYWDEDLQQWIQNPVDLSNYKNSFFPFVAHPLFMSWLNYKNKRYAEALAQIERCRAKDWLVACRDWLLRRRSVKQILETREATAEGWN